jgi:hypothetical protein
MKSLVIAAFVALGLTAGIAPMTHACTAGSPQTTSHQGPYDNTANSLGGRYVGGGD